VHYSVIILFYVVISNSSKYKVAHDKQIFHTVSLTRVVEYHLPRVNKHDIQ